MEYQFLRYPIRGQKFSYSVEIKEHLLSRKTPFQQIDVYETYCFGKILTLDGHVQLSTLDEFAYHESLVHIPLMSLPNAKRALVLGGGDGGVLRELCRWRKLESIEMVEIDEGVVAACKEVLPELSAGSFEDPRVHLIIGDALEFMAKVSTPYDLIVMDITDVYEGESGAISESLFTEKFHQDTYRALSSNGLLVSQADNHVFCPYSLGGLLETLRKEYANVGWFQSLVPSFGGFSAYCWAGKEANLSEVWNPEGEMKFCYLNDLSYRLAFSHLMFRSQSEGH